jgi:hypothetical protein
MTIWNGLGINYGHQPNHNPYDPAQVAADLDFLQSVGISKIRMAYPTFDGAGIAASQSLVITALARGMYVIWGVSAGSPVNSSRWATFKSYVLNTLAPWAQSLASPRFELAIGNEEELHCDGTTLTVNTVIADMANLAAQVKNVYTYGPVSYQSPSGFINNWVTNGSGSLDRLGFNYYSRTARGMRLTAQTIISSFPGVGYISEWGTPNGFPDMPEEHIWCDLTAQQLRALQTSGLAEAYFFCYRDGGFGLPANAWALVTSTGNFRLAATALFGVRPWFVGNPNAIITRAQPPGRPTKVRAAAISRPTF